MHILIRISAANLPSFITALVENYGTLKKWLQTEGVKFLTETDTEVIAQLIGYIYSKGELREFEMQRRAEQIRMGGSAGNWEAARHIRTGDSVFGLCRYDNRRKEGKPADFRRRRQ